MLLTLAQGPRHGYALKEALRQKTSGRLNLGPGTLYRTIRHLEEHGLIEETAEAPDPADDDERRIYYRITPLGRDVAAAEAGRLEELLALARAERLIT